MAEWGRSALWLLGLYALFQLLVWGLVLPASGPAPSPLAPVLYPHAPARGSPADLCAQSSFTQEGTSARIALFDPTPLITGMGPSAKAPHKGEEVWRQLSLLRESTRDGWLHFAGDVSLKQTWYDLVQLMQRQGPAPAVPLKEGKKRFATREASKAEVRVGSTRVSFAYRPLVADLTKDWSSTVWKGVAPPSVVVYSVGTWDVVNGTAALSTQVDTLLAALRHTLAEKIAAGRRVPTVLFLSAPAFADASGMAAGLSVHAQERVEQEAALMQQLQQGIADMQAQLALVKPLGATAAAATSTAAAEDVSSVDGGASAAGSGKQYVLFVDAKPLAAPLGGRLPSFALDGGVHVLLNPAGSAASLAAFVSCHLGQPVWALHAFTPGQISLALLWITAIAWWALIQARKIGPALFASARNGGSNGSARGGKYQRVGTSDGSEIELGGAPSSSSHGDSSAAASSSSSSSSSSSAAVAAANLSALGSFRAYFSSPAWANVLSCLVQLGCVLLFMFLSDSNHRVTWWLVGDKLYVRDTFLFVLGVLFLLAWRSVGLTSDKGDALLNREQTEEWKGVMQLLFVLYHYFAAKEMYNLIRVFIAAYVWMTGYGNFFFFAKTNDYSPARLVKMLFRLNFFVALVCVALNREFMQYYVCALHTFYFLAVYAMMGIAWQWNKNDRLLALKFLVLFAALFLLFDVPSLGLFQAIFSPFSLFYWNSSLHEWWFRSSLDHYATALGMLCAWNVKRLEDFLARIGGNATTDLSSSSTTSTTSRKMLAIQAGVAASCIAAGLAWMVYCLWLPKAAYNAQHPYTSIIPIALYILLRNLTPFLRRHVLFLFTWFGKITLETYILQFHIWLSDDAATIITYLPDYPLFNWILSSAIYIALSLLMFQITNILSDALIPRVCSGRELLFKIFVLLGGWYTLHNVVHAAVIATA